MTIYNGTNWSDITQIYDPVTELELLTEFNFTQLRDVSIEHL